MLSQSLRDLYELLLTCAYIFNKCFRGICKTYHSKILICFRISLVPVDTPFASLFITEEHVLADGQIRDQCEFLVDNNDSLFLGIFNVMKFAYFAVVNYVAFIGAKRINSAENVHQCRFTGTVLADQRMDLSLFNLKVDVVECLNARKSFGYAFHFKQNFCHVSPLS